MLAIVLAAATLVAAILLLLWPLIATAMQFDSWPRILEKEARRIKREKDALLADR